MTNERRAGAEELVRDLQAIAPSELEIVEQIPGRRGVTFVEWVYVTVGPTVGIAGGQLFKRMVDDAYDVAKEWAKRQRAKRGGRGRHIGVSIGTKEDGELRKWHTGKPDGDGDGET